MNKNPSAYSAWLNASHECTAFYKENLGNWTEKVSTKYHSLRETSDRLYAEWLAASTGQSVAEVECAINDSIHSARD
jgi:hypothetical protein